MLGVRIEESWEKVLAAEVRQPYFKMLSKFVDKEYHTKTIFPHPEDLFAAFRETPWETVRVVIVGQDPYHGPGQAMGLAFSVREDVPSPPSLRNIFKEVGYEKAVDSSQYSVYRTGAGTRALGHVQHTKSNGDLTHWARQGVLLLNSILTVEAGKAGSHALLGKENGEGGWEQFTDAVLKKISDEKTGVVFLLWGTYARTKKSLIDATKHFVLEAPHPSPLSAHSGFFGCGHFTKTNDYLRSRGEREIEW